MYLNTLQVEIHTGKNLRNKTSKKIFFGITQYNMYVWTIHNENYYNRKTKIKQFEPKQFIWCTKDCPPLLTTINLLYCFF